MCHLKHAYITEAGILLGHGNYGTHEVVDEGISNLYTMLYGLPKPHLTW